MGKQNEAEQKASTYSNLVGLGLAAVAAMRQQ
jgi:hypothetical protein